MATRVSVSLEADFAAGSTVKLVGSIPQLGSWDIAKAPALEVDKSSSRYTTTIELADDSVRDFEYKFALLLPSSGGDAGSAASWEWQPGPNRRWARVREGTMGGSSCAVAATWMRARDGTGVIATDAYLESHREHLKLRYAQFQEALAAIEAYGGGLDAFSRGYERMGFTRAEQAGVRGISFREWAPGARSIHLVGDFNAWDQAATPLARDPFGVFSAFLPDKADSSEAISHNSFVRLWVVGADGEAGWRLPAWIRYTTRDPERNEYVGRYWNPPAGERHAWKHPRPRTALASDYTAIPGMPRLPCGTDWEGVVSPGAELPPAAAAAPDASAAAAGGGGSTSSATRGAGGKAGEEPTTTTGGREEAGSAAAAGHHRRGRTGMETVSVSRTRSAFEGVVSPTGGAPAAGEGGASRPSAAPLPDPGRAGLRIYEAHVGMSSDEGKEASYTHFADNVLPRIAGQGYNAVQLMAIMEHPYYGSFGYHVSSFLAPSSRFGTPEELKRLVDVAHGLGLLVIMDCVHSHAVKNVVDGLNKLDGTDHQYFHAGARGEHALWDSRLFDYSKLEVQRLLLSSLRLFVEEYRFDGFRFDGVTSMMYLHHGLSVGFSGDYSEYFGADTDLSAVVYLMLANTLLHSLPPAALSIAEDVSGMPTLCRPVWEGGVGFDYRLAMALPDMWIKLLKESRDEDWDMEALAWTLTNRRWQERAIAYAESHDQALVGDKTIAFWLMDKEMYWHMSTLEHPRHAAIDRGLALHKMIRLLTYSLGGEGWLGFMGNEFGHPEWVDFPREGNGWSYHYCRRQWHLVEDPLLYYKNLQAWEAGMHGLEEAFPWLLSRENFVSTKHNGDKVLVFDRGTSAGPLVFAFNFHPTNSYTDYRVGAPEGGDWQVALDSDHADFAGYGRVDPAAAYPATKEETNGRPFALRLYLPARTCVVLKKRGTGPAKLPYARPIPTAPSAPAEASGAAAGGGAAAPAGH